MTTTARTLFTALALAMVSLSHATPVLRISDGTNTVTITDNGFDNVSGRFDGNGTLGIVSQTITNFPGWSVAIAQGITKPVYGSVTAPILQLTWTATRTAGAGTGTLTMQFSETSFDQGASALILTELSGSLGTSTNSIQVRTYHNPDNQNFGTAFLLTDNLFTGTNNFSTNRQNMVALAFPSFALNVVVDLTQAGGQTTSGTARLSVSTVRVKSITRVNARTNNLGSQSWLVSYSVPVSGVSNGNFSLAIGGEFYALPYIASALPMGTAPASNWTVYAFSSLGFGTFGTLGLNMINNTGLSTNFLNLPFVGQVYTIDDIDPNTTITARPPLSTNSPTATFSFTGSDVGVGVTNFRCQLDNAPEMNCISPMTYTGLLPGTHTFQVLAVDGLGNHDSSAAIATWTVLPPPPLPRLSDLTRLGGGGFQFAFTNATGVVYSVLASTNISVPLSNWSVLGPMLEAPPGHFQFTDTDTNPIMRYYKVRAP